MFRRSFETPRIQKITNDDKYFRKIRNIEFRRLNQQKHVYFDFTGGNLYPKSLLEKHFRFLKNTVLGNPHSINPTSLLATEKVEQTRKAILQFFNADDYYCIFTQNASGALHIVGENYCFDSNSIFLLTTDNHNSVNGIREYCKTKGGNYEYALINYEDLTINEEDLTKKLQQFSGASNKLFAFPAQSNVSGAKHNLNYIKQAQEQGWDVLLDAAAFVPTNSLDLQKHSPDFVCVSFYKMFGYPTGIGCLLVKKSKFEKLQKPYFAGGTVRYVATNSDMFFLHGNHEKFEDGTVNYLEIPAIANGLDFLLSIGMPRITKRIKALTEILMQKLQLLKHSNGKHLIHIFGPMQIEDRGGTIIFNVEDKNGITIPFEKVEAQANNLNISLRTGCFCNPGIDEVNNCVTAEESMKYYTMKETGSFKDMIYLLGKMRGAVRISVGVATSMKDIERLMEFLSSYKE